MPDYYKQHQGGGGEWGYCSAMVKPSCHHLGLSLVAVFEVVGSIPAGDLPFFLFLAKLLFFGGRRLVARDFGALGIGSDGVTLTGLGECPRRQKWRFWHV